MYAVTNGYLKDVSVDQIPEFERRLAIFMEQRYGDVLDAIRSTGKLEPETEEKLQKALTELLADFVVKI